MEPHENLQKDVLSWNIYLKISLQLRKLQGKNKGVLVYTVDAIII
jgi:hypothetical protein